MANSKWIIKLYKNYCLALASLDPNTGSLITGLSTPRVESSTEASIESSGLSGVRICTSLLSVREKEDVN